MLCLLAKLGFRNNIAVIDFDMPWLLSFSPDNTLLAATSRNNNYVRLWDVFPVL